jgi:hypothetical protein
MSHFTEVELEMTGSEESVIRALCEMQWRGCKKLTRDQILYTKERKNLRGYHGDVREQLAHIIIDRRQVGSLSNDIGLEKMSNGRWKLHVSEFDNSYYNANWQKRLLSEWAVQRIGCEAENRGYSWQKQESECGQHVYVTVNQRWGG